MAISKKIRAVFDLATKFRPNHLRLLHRILELSDETVKVTLDRIAKPSPEGKRPPAGVWDAIQFADIPTQYHLWYYNSAVWGQLRFLGNRLYKSVGDLWNYQEILFDLKPRLIVEFGTHAGGSALFFSKILKLIQPDSKVFTVDITMDPVPSEVRQDPHIEFMECSSTDPKVYEHIRDLRKRYPGPVFFILDSDHAKHHVLGELKALRDLTVPGDYVIVEDSNINGHPVLPGWGDGPYEAIEEYEHLFPNDYKLDERREAKFGFTWAPKGFLIRQ